MLNTHTHTHTYTHINGQWSGVENKNSVRANTELAMFYIGDTHSIYIYIYIL